MIHSGLLVALNRSLALLTQKTAELRSLSSRLARNRSEFVYFGDQYEDELSAKNASMTFVSVGKAGFASKYQIDSYNELIPMLNSNAF